MISTKTRSAALSMAISCSVLLNLPAACFAIGGATAVLSNIASSPTSDVPGIPGLKFRPGTTTSSAFDRIFGSPDGNRWVFSGFVDAPASDDDVIVRGSGPTAAGAEVIARAGSPVPFEPGINWNILDTRTQINNSGQVVFHGTTTASSNSRRVAFFDGTNVNQVAAQGTATPVAGANWSTTMNGGNVTSDGRVGFQGTTTPTPTQYLTVFDGSVISQSGVTIPTNQLAGLGNAPLNVLTSDSFRVSADGNTFVYRSTLSTTGTGLSTSNNTIVAGNNSVVLQTGVPVPGWAANTAEVISLSSEASAIQLSGDGVYLTLRGAVNDGVGAANQTDFVWRNNAILAATDQPIFSGATELWDDTLFAQTFFLNTSNNLGDYVIGGTTNNPDTLRDAVKVFNGFKEIIREGDPVDLSGNGLFDDDAFINIFRNDGGFLTDDLRYYFVASLKDGQGTPIGNAILTLVVPEPVSLGWVGLLAAALIWRRR